MLEFQSTSGLQPLEASGRRLRARVGDHLFPIPIDAGLLAISDPQQRRRFLHRWQQEYAAQPPAPTTDPAPVQGADE